jgi:basic amino acid/polyamine antiporter, APA family
MSQRTEAGAALPKSLGLATATFVVISSMVGTGVLTTSGYTVCFVGSNQLMLLLWLLGGAVAVCGALTVAELSAAMPRSGGDYVYLYEAYGPLAAFLSGWVSFLIGFGGPIAVSASAAASYLLAPAGLKGNVAELAQTGLASVAILVFAAVHVSGGARTIGVQGGMTAVKLVILCVMALAGLAGGWGNWANLGDRPTLSTELGITMTASLVYISYGYTGWNAASYLAGEIDRPSVQLPRAILIGTGIVVVLYLAINTAYALALPAEEIRKIASFPPFDPAKIDAVKPIAEIAANRLYGSWISRPLSVAIGLTLLASVSAYVLTGPRVAYAMAVSGQFPAIAGKLSTRFGTPAIATGLQVGWSLVLLWALPFERLLMYSSVGLAIFSMLTVSSVYVLRWKRPDLVRPFVTPGYPVVPAIFLLVNGLLVAAVFRERPWVSLGSLGSILAGVPVYFVWTWFTNDRGGSDSMAAEAVE